jgi:hypothetical protein
VIDPVNECLEVLGARPPPAKSGLALEPSFKWGWEPESPSGRDVLAPSSYSGTRLKGQPDDVLAQQTRDQFVVVTFQEGKHEWIVLGGGAVIRWRPGDPLQSAPQLYNQYTEELRNGKHECKYLGQVSTCILEGSIRSATAE